MQCARCNDELHTLPFIASWLDALLLTLVVFFVCVCLCARCAPPLISQALAVPPCALRLRHIDMRTAGVATCKHFHETATTTTKCSPALECRPPSTTRSLSLSVCVFLCDITECICCVHAYAQTHRWRVFTQYHRVSDSNLCKQKTVCYPLTVCSDRRRSGAAMFTVAKQVEVNVATAASAMRIAPALGCVVLCRWTALSIAPRCGATHNTHWATTMLLPLLWLVVHRSRRE